MTRSIRLVILTKKIYSFYGQYILCVLHESNIPVYSISNGYKYVGYTKGTIVMSLVIPKKNRLWLGLTLSDIRYSARVTANAKFLNFSGISIDVGDWDIDRCWGIKWGNFFKNFKTYKTNKNVKKYPTFWLYGSVPLESLLWISTFYLL